MDSQIKTARASAVCSTYGGELKSFTLDGKEYIWNGDPAYWSSHSPVLFPTVCATYEESVKFEGVAYPLKKHGFARKREFTLLEATSDKLVYQLSDDAETKKLYPYSFRLLITHKITDEGFSTEFRVVNTDNKPIWFTIGGHPGFRVPMNEGEKFTDYKIVFEKVENEDVIYTTSYGGGYIDPSFAPVDKLRNTNEWYLDHKDHDVDVLITPKLKSRKVKLVHKDTGKGVELDFNGFNALGVWTPPGKNAPFVCLEPWNGLPAELGESGNFEDKPYAVKLPVGAEYAVEYKVKVLA